MDAGGRDPSRPIDEEAAKKNTDCVYFLASPLTCKKGNDCEYRHSEGARVNPRDCWFWLNGNCLNPTCSFRHPPLDGFVGAPVTTHQGSIMPSTLIAMSTPGAHVPATHTSNKITPCYYFQMGACLKGDRCPYMHDVQPGNNPVVQQTAKVDTPVTEPTSALKSTSWVLDNSVKHKMTKISANKPEEAPQTSTRADVDVKTETMLTSGLLVKSGIIPSQFSNVTSHTVPSVSVRAEGHYLEPLTEHAQNGREADESLRESSPGFDVLVDDECEDTSYFHVDGRDTSSHEADNLNVVNDFDYSHSSIYNSMAQFERETHKTHNEVGEYDRYRWCDRYSQDDCRYSEKTIDRVSIDEKRALRREGFPNEIDGSDLHHRLLKKTKVNGLRSAINTDHNGKPSQKDDRYITRIRYHSRNSGRDQHHFPHESSISKRLQGRVMLPGKPPSDKPGNMHLKERDGGNYWARSSASVHPLNHPGRLDGRIIRSMHEARNLEGQPKMDGMESSNFAGPKSLAELKGAKFSNDTKDRLSEINSSTVTGERKNLRLNKTLGLHESEVSLSFEGPKPLSEILKRKREAALQNDSTSSKGRKRHQKVIEDHAAGSMVTAAIGCQNLYLPESQNGECHTVSVSEVSNSTSVEEGLSMMEGPELPHASRSSAKMEILEDVRLADNIEDPESSADDQKEVKYDVAGVTDCSKEDEVLSHTEQSSRKEDMHESGEGMLVDIMGNSKVSIEQRDTELKYDEDDGASFRRYDENDHKDKDGVDDKDDDDDDNDDDGGDDDDDDDFARKIGGMFS